MSEQTMKILKMLEEGKITAAEAGELLVKIEELEEKESRPDPRPNPQHRVHFEMPNIGNIPIPPIPQIPDINKIVNDALREAFSGTFGDSEDDDAPTAGTVAYRGVQFAGARMEHTDLTDTKMDSNTRLQGADLRYASLTDADLRGANLQGANLSYSDFSDTNFKGANMQGAQLHHGSYIDTNFSHADLHGADFSMGNFSNASFENVKQPGLSLRGVTLVGVKYEEAPDDTESQPMHAGEDAAIDFGGPIIEDTSAQVEVDIQEASMPPEEPMSPEQPHHTEEKDLSESTIF